MGRTIECAGQYILVLAFPTTVAILLGFRDLVNVLLTSPSPTNVGKHHPMRATTDRGPRSVCLSDSCKRLTPRIGHPLHRSVWVSTLSGEVLGRLYALRLRTEPVEVTGPSILRDGAKTPRFLRRPYGARQAERIRKRIYEKPR